MSSSKADEEEDEEEEEESEEESDEEEQEEEIEEEARQLDNVAARSGVAGAAPAAPHNS